MSQEINDQLVLISGESSTGKSMALRNMRDPEGVMYLNCEAGKRLPFRNKFQSFTITDPYQVHEAFEHAHGNANFHTIVVDTVTFLMDMFESVHVIGADNTMQAWGDYAQFFKNLMQYHVASSDKSVVFLGHTRKEYNESSLSYESSVPVKGSLKNNGIEAFFSTVVSTKTIKLDALKDFDKSLLEITAQEEALGYKHVFQTQLTKETVGERIRSPFGMFTPEQTYMDNDAQKLLDVLGDYYQ